MRSTFILASLAAAFTVVACQDSIGPSQHVDDSSPRFVISDGAHGGNPHFYFLPPLVSEPQYSGTFDSTLHPIVKVCALPACNNDLFTFVRGPGRDDIDIRGEAYRLDWHTRNSGLVTGTTYRIRVYVGTQLLGYLDVRVLGKQGRAVPLPTDVIGLRQGHVLRLRFRIEEGAVHRPGSKIAFVSTRDGNQEVYVMNADGSNERRLTNNPEYDRDITWSPDGNKIAFLSLRNNVNDIYVMNVDGTGLTNLTRNLGLLNNRTPAWSPDGQWIAFAAQRSGKEGIWVMRSDGTMARQITFEGEDMPDWSPDGTKLVVRGQRMAVVDGSFRSVSDIIVMNADGTNAVRIFSVVVACPSHLDWSPDGQWIAFDNCFGPSTITLISPDGSQFVQLNAGGNHSEHPSWSPDGSMIAFWSERGLASGLSDIYVMRRDGTGLQRLTDDPAYDFDPSWSP